MVLRLDLEVNADFISFVSYALAEIRNFAAEEIFLVKQTDFFEDAATGEKNRAGNIVNRVNRVLGKDLGVVRKDLGVVRRHGDPCE
jgi:hypothetical protein